MRIALAQMDCTPDEGDNLQAALGFVMSAKMKNADVVLLPELFNTGYYLDGMRQKAQTQRGPGVLTQAATEFGLHVLAGMPETKGNVVYNSAYWFESGKVGRSVYRKVHLFPGTPISENACFAVGKSSKPLKTPLGLLGVQICMDLRYPNGSRRLAEQGADLLVYLSAFPNVRIHQWLPLLKARAIENQCFVAGCNRVGTDSIEMGGQSVVFGPQGECLGQLDGTEEGMLVADLDFGQVRKARKALKLW